MRLSVLLSVTVLAGAASLAAEDVVVARMDGQTIVRREVEFSLSSFRATIAREVAAQDPARAETLRVIVRQAIARAAENKVQWMLAAERGLVSDAGYGTFRTAWLEENNRRRRQIEKGEVLYGPVAFSEEAFYEYALSHAILQLKGILVPSPSSDRIRALYDSVAPTAFRKHERLRLARVTTAASSVEVRERLRVDLMNSSDLSEVVQRYQCRAVLCTTVTGGGDGAQEEQEGLLQRAGRLRTGEVSSWTQTEEGWEIVKCVERSLLTLVPLEEAYGILRGWLVDDAYAEIVRTKIAELRVVVDEDVLNTMAGELMSGAR